MKRKNLKKRTPRSKPRQPSHLETTFSSLYQDLNPGSRFKLIPEVTIPGRRFRYDFRIEGTNVMIEVMGGIYATRRYGHSSGAGIARDYEKARFACYNGFIVLSFDSKAITNEKITELLNWLERTYTTTES